MRDESPKPRNTKQLSVILGVLKARKQPVSAPDILKLAQKKAPSLNKTTVYRTLDRLLKDRAIEVVNVKEGVLHYELRSEGLTHHHHFVCSHCTKIFCLEGNVGNIKRLLPKVFSLESYELTLRGICKDCRE